MGLIGCPETSVWNYHSALHYIPEERRSPLCCSTSLPEIMHEEDLLSVIVCMMKMIFLLRCDCVHDEDDLFVRYDYVHDEDDLFVKM